MTTPLTFGIEFEMSVVTGFDSGREFHKDERIINFTKEMYDKPESRESSPRQYEQWVAEMPWKPVARHMAKTLDAAGFKATVDKADNTSWDFTCDISIEDPEEEKSCLVRYTYQGIEMRSPAMYFTPESLQALADVLKLLKRTYMIYTNHSTGLHVHVGDGKKGWEFSILQKLFALIWVFEPQLNTLFTPSRVDGDFNKSMRTLSPYSKRIMDKKFRKPRPTEGLIRIMDCKTFEQLYKWFCPGSLRVSPYAKDDDGNENRKPTIEWRHHEGTMDEVSACMWIKTVVGIMNYLRTVKPEAFTKLASMAEQEHWQKVGDGEDDRRERERGPILAEGRFTIIDLLGVIGVYEPAKFYKERGLYKTKVDRDKQWFVGAESQNSGGSSQPADDTSDEESIMAAPEELLDEWTEIRDGTVW